MSAYSRTAVVRGSDAPPSIISSHRSKSYFSENRRSTPSTQPASSQRPGTYRTRSSRLSRPPPTTVVRRVSPEDFPLPHSTRDIPLPPIKPGQRISITITKPEATSRSSRTPSGYTERTTETYIFSPLNDKPKDYPAPPPSRPSLFSARSHRSHRAVRMPSYSGESAYKTTYVRRPERLALPPPPAERSRLSSGATGTRRSPGGASASRSVSKSVSQPASRSVSQPLSRKALEEDSWDFDDTETLAPSDSVSQASGKARRRRSSAKSGRRSVRS